MAHVLLKTGHTTRYRDFPSCIPTPADGRGQHGWPTTRRAGPACRRPKRSAQNHELPITGSAAPRLTHVEWLCISIAVGKGSSTSRRSDQLKRGSAAHTRYAAVGCGAPCMPAIGFISAAGRCGVRRVSDAHQL